MSTKISRAGNDRLDMIRNFIGTFDPVQYELDHDEAKNGQMPTNRAIMLKMLELNMRMQLSMEAVFILKYQDHRYMRHLDSGQVAILKKVKDDVNISTKVLQETLVSLPTCLMQ